MAINTNMIEFDGVDATYVTFASALTSDAEGKLTKISASKTVDLAAVDEIFSGKVIKVEKDSAAVVQTRGYMEFSYSGVTAPTVDHCKLSADANGGVKVDATNGKEYLVLNVDEVNKIVGFIL